MSDEIDYLDAGEDRLAYQRIAGSAPGVVFLGGFSSDMSGTKASALARHCAARGHAFLRFDYQGHGRSSGRFETGTIGRWTGNALAVIDRLTEGPLVLVGSSMGGWIMLLAARARPERAAALLGVACAPDFTEELLWAGCTEEQRRALTREGAYRQVSAYGDEPHRITAALIEEGRSHLVLRRPLAIRCPVRLLHGTADADVPWQLSQRLLHRLQSEDARLTLVHRADHRFSGPAQIALLLETLDGLLAPAHAA